MPSKTEMGTVLLRASTGARLNNHEVEILTQATLDLLSKVDAIKTTVNDSVLIDSTKVAKIKELLK